MLKPVKSGPGRVLVLKVPAAVVVFERKPRRLLRSKLTASCWP